ncbi:MAG: flavin monoamine oxidase family protein [Candidatus Competibacterales bacterium]
MKVIIVGAGASGITAAQILKDKGIEFEILEANSVTGGRLKESSDFADFPIDLGAEWIHKSIRAAPPIASKLLHGKEENHRTFKYVPRTILQYKDGTLHNKNWMRFILALIQDYKFVDSTWFDFVDRMVTPEIEERIHLNTAVSKIDYSSADVLVTAESGQLFRADKILVTVPIKILQDGLIEFIPELPASQLTAIHGEKVGDGLKVFMEFSEQFYPDLILIGNLFGNPFQDDSSYYNATLGKNSNKHILGLFAHGEKATRYTSQGSNEAIFQFVISELDEIFDGRASKTYKKHLIQNWSQEPFIRGSYSQRKGNVKKMAAPLSNKVFFAGEAMNTKGRTIAVHGAMESSHLAVDQMLGSMS